MSERIPDCPLEKKPVVGGLRYGDYVSPVRDRPFDRIGHRHCKLVAILDRQDPRLGRYPECAESIARAMAMSSDQACHAGTVAYDIRLASPDPSWLDVCPRQDVADQIGMRGVYTRIDHCDDHAGSL